MKNLTLSYKITIGFGLLILIAVLLGSVAVINMKGVEKGADKLANIYVPEVAVGNNVERYSLLTMYDIRGYSLSEDKKLLASGRESLEKVKHYLDEAKALAQKYSLTALGELEAKARKEVHRYEALVGKTEEFNRKIDHSRNAMDEGAKMYMTSAHAFLHHQEKELEKEIKGGASERRILERMQKVNLIADVIDTGNDTRVKNFKFQSTEEMSIIESAMANFEKIDSLLDEVEKLTRKAEDKASIKHIHEGADEYKKAIETYLSAWKELQNVNKERGAAAEQVLAAAQETAHLAMEHTDEIAKESASNLATASYTMIVGLVLAFVIGIVLAAYLIRSITKPIVQAVQIIQEANSQVLAASDQIASSATALADGATQQASSVEEISATIEESTSINNQNSENATEANVLAKGANDAAEEGNHKIKELMDSMVKITDASEQIAKIVKTIDEIAFQTNLLALNAAVEAARAGEHGLGFAVVADEVKNLAQRSADSAKETASIIETTIEQIKHGNDIANTTNEAFADILDKANKTSNLIGEIAISIKEQASGMNQITAAMGQIDENTQSNAASSEEAAAASEELNAQANAMMESVVEVAKMVGLDTSGTHTQTKKTTIMPKPKLISSKPVVKKSVKRAASPKQNDDVFPLDDEDMKEF